MGCWKIVKFIIKKKQQNRYGLLPVFLASQFKLIHQVL